MYAVDTVKGEILWTSVGVTRGAVYAEPKLVERLPNTPKVYVIEGINGKVRQHDGLTGTVDWTFDCRDVSGIACNDAVEADFRYGRLVEGLHMYHCSQMNVTT
jgi:hypothetical protein